MDANNGYNINLKKPLKPYKVKQLKQRKKNHKPRYNYSNVLQLHSLLEQNNVAKAYLCTLLNVSIPQTALRLINKPTNLNIQQLINLSFALNIDIHSLLDVIIKDLHISNCVNSTNDNIKPFVSEDIKILHKSSEWFNR